MSAPFASDLELDDRSQLLLKTLVEDYVRSGQPVGSKLLLQSSGLSLSSATIRNVMSDLEGLGLVTTPHTSAGRIPTVEGYRLFVDSLINIQPLEFQEVDRLKTGLEGQHDTHSMIQTASGLLSGLTHMAGIVTLPRYDQVTLQQIEFLNLSEGRILVILVTNTQEVHNRVIMPGRTYESSELIQAGNYLTEQFSGMELKRIHQHLLDDMKQVQQDMNNLMQLAIQLGEQALADEERSGDDYIVAGETQLMGYDELSDIERLRELFEAFREKRDLLSLLDQCISAEGVKLFIGHESGLRELDECSVVTAPYEMQGDVVGVLAVVGPTRMKYNRVIPMVDITAKLLSAALNSKD